MYFFLVATLIPSLGMVSGRILHASSSKPGSWRWCNACHSRDRTWREDAIMGGFGVLFMQWSGRGTNYGYRNRAKQSIFKRKMGEYGNILVATFWARFT